MRKTIRMRIAACTALSGRRRSSSSGCSIAPVHSALLIVLHPQRVPDALQRQHLFDRRQSLDVLVAELERLVDKAMNLERPFGYVDLGRFAVGSYVKGGIGRRSAEVCRRLDIRTGGHSVTAKGRPASASVVPVILMNLRLPIADFPVVISGLGWYADFSLHPKEIGVAQN